eukprot:7378108-Prymnesium_polylepis.1
MPMMESGFSASKDFLMTPFTTTDGTVLMRERSTSAGLLENSARSRGIVLVLPIYVLISRSAGEVRSVAAAAVRSTASTRAMNICTVIFNILAFAAGVLPCSPPSQCLQQLH